MHSTATQKAQKKSSAFAFVKLCLLRSTVKCPEITPQEKKERKKKKQLWQQGWTEDKRRRFEKVRSGANYTGLIMCSICTGRLLTTVKKIIVLRCLGLNLGDTALG